MSTFGSLNTALLSLHAQRRGLDVTGQNIANANTEGYSRQRVDLQSVGGTVVPALHTRSDTAAGGVVVADVQRLRDGFLETRAQTEHGRAASLTAQQGVLASMEQVFGEPSDTGLAASFADFWAGWDDVANGAGGDAARDVLLQRAETLTDGLHAIAGGLDDLWQAGREQLRTVAADATTTAGTVAELNAAIARATNAGLPVNELTDRRDALVVHLTDLVGGRARAGGSGMVDVYVGSTALVHGSGSEALTITGTGSPTGVEADPVRLTWAASGAPVTDPGGTAGGLIEGLDVTLPAYAGKLDAVAAAVVSRVNSQHAAGYDADGQAGQAFFAGASARDVRVAIPDPRRIAASRTPGGNTDGGNADAIAALASDATGPGAAYRALVADLGVAAQTANRRSDIQANVVAAVDAARDAQSGVDIDEEMVDMLAFQHAYEGAARMLTAVDSTLDTLINRTGLVGR